MQALGRFGISVVLSLSLALPGCGGSVESPPGVNQDPPTGGGAATDEPALPLPSPHPAVSGLTTTEFAQPLVGLTGVYPDGWALNNSVNPATNSILELTHTDAHLDLGYLPGVLATANTGAPSEMPPEVLQQTVLDMAEEAAISSTAYFAGCSKTLLDASPLFFGDHEVRIVSMLIQRPEATESEPSTGLSNPDHLKLAPHGEPRLGRQYIWLVGDNVWIAQLIAPPAQFHQRAIEIEEVMLPSLSWTTPSP